MGALLFADKQNLFVCLLTLFLLCCCTQKPQSLVIPSEKKVTYSPPKLSKWPVPAHWQALPAGEMQQALYLIQSGKLEAQFSIVKLEGDSGSVLANVNRWRRQVNLLPIDAVDLNEHVDELILNNKRFYISKQRNADVILAAIFKPSLDVTWFFKLQGPDTIIRKETDAFLKVLKTLTIKE